MDVAHENDGAFRSLMVQRGDVAQFFHLIFVSHGNDSAFRTNQRAHEIDYSREAGNHIRSLDEFSAALSQVPEIAGTNADAPDHAFAFLNNGRSAGSLMEK